MTEVPTTVEMPVDLPARRTKGGWTIDVGERAVPASNLDKVLWGPEGYTKADLLAYYHAIAPAILPFLCDRPLTLKRMPDGADGEFFYAKNAPEHTPDWVRTVPVVSRESGKRVDYLLAQDTASLLWLANLGCIEMHPWHSRVDDLGHPDYAFFDLDPFEVDFEVVADVALSIKVVLDQIGLRSYARTSGATGMQVYVPIDRVHSAAQVREWVGRICGLIQRADPERTTMAWPIEQRTGKVFLDHNMNTEGKNIAATWSLRPERGATVATPLRWQEVERGVRPGHFTIATVWPRVDQAAFAPVLEGGQDLREAMRMVGMDPAEVADPATHDVLAEEAGDLGEYRRKRDFARTPEPSGADADADADAAPPTGRRFVVQHHLATRLHHDLRLESGGVARSWAIPKGLPEMPGVRHLAVPTEDHPLSYLTFEGDIPEGEYGAGTMRIWDSGVYEAVEWTADKVSIRLSGQRERGEFHLFRTSQGQWMVVRVGEGSPTPPPPGFEPMLAVSGRGAFDDPAWCFEVKWDGVRALATVARPGAGDGGETVLASRNGNNITAGYPELGGLWERVLARNAVLDGELVVLDAQGRSSFQRLQRRMHVRDERALQRLRREAPVTYMVFDVLAVDGSDITDLPLSERGRILDDILIPGAGVRRSTAVAERGKELFAAAVDMGVEGLVAKRLDAAYQSGRRSRDWLKLKIRRTVDCVIGGWLPGAGARTPTFASLLVGLHGGDGLRLVGRVGTGFDEDGLADMAARLADLATHDSPFAHIPAGTRGPGNMAEAQWVVPQLVCTVEFAEVTDEGLLRAPSFKGLRSDAQPHDCRLKDLRPS